MSIIGCCVCAESTTKLRRVIRGLDHRAGRDGHGHGSDVQSVAELWFFTADLVFVLLFPQLLWALFDPQANRTGSIAAFSVSLVLRLGGGIPLFGLPAFIPYAEALVARNRSGPGPVVRFGDGAVGFSRRDCWRRPWA